MERKEYPIGIILFIIFIIVLDVAYLFYLVYYLMFVDDYLTTFLSFSIVSIVMWIDALFTTLSLVIIPYGFIKRRNWARIYTLVFLSWSAFGAIGYIVMTGEKTFRYLLFVIYVLFVMYLLMSTAKRYFGKIPIVIAPSKIMEAYKYRDYTLYAKLVRLKNGKIQIIYFFSKRKPKSGTPATLPYGFEVEVSKRSGLPYLKKWQLSPNISWYFYAISKQIRLCLKSISLAHVFSPTSWDYKGWFSMQFPPVEHFV